MSEQKNQNKKGLVPRLRFPEFRDAGEWEVQKLKTVCEVNPPNSTLPDRFVYIDLESVKEGEDFRFKSYGLAPKSTADFAFLLHGFHFLIDEGTIAIILPHGVLFRGGVEQRIRAKLLKDGHIDTVIGLPANLFFSTGIPVCILVLKKCKKPDDVLFINAAGH